MSNKSRRLKALEKRVAALELQKQAPQVIEVGQNTGKLAEAVIRTVNQITSQKGQAQLLI